MHQQDLFARRVELHAMDRFLRQAAGVDLGHYDNSDWYDRMARARRDVSWRPVQLATSTINLGASIIGVLGLTSLLASLHPLLVVLSLVSVLPWVLLQRRVTRKIYEFHFDFTSRDREKWYFADLLVEATNAKDLRAFGLARHFLAKHEEISRENYKKLAGLLRRSSLMAVGSGLLTGIALAAAYAFITKRGFDRALTPGDLTAAIAGFAALTSQASGISSALLNLDQHATFLEDYFAFLAIEPLVIVKSNPTPLPPKLETGIVVRDVKFAYPNSTREVLTGASLEVHPGELIALVGDNGHGKTTLVNMLMRFYDPTAGSVSLDGVDLRDVDPSQLRSRIGVLFQDFSKFQLTLRDNVWLGRIDRTVEDTSIISALAAARADHLREKLPNKLDSRVGRLFDGGQELSGGEWQRLALARMVFRDADIWILDEPTSNLDPEAEAAIFSELKQQLAGRIGIVISHRFSTVRVADRIYVIRDGRVLESGSHDELVALRGRYAELFELQASSYR
jgi:ATP-binding cassette subfamily B protein